MKTMMKRLLIILFVPVLILSAFSVTFYAVDGEDEEVIYIEEEVPEEEDEEEEETAEPTDAPTEPPTDPPFTPATYGYQKYAEKADQTVFRRGWDLFIPRIPPILSSGLLSRQW